MRRIVIWLASTVTVVVLLFGYHTSTDSTAATQPATSSSAPSDPAPAPSSATPSSSPTSRPKSAGSSSSPRPSAAAPSTPSTTSYTGAVAQTRWGPVEVKITVTRGTVTAVDVLQSPSGNHRDLEINDRALPTLVQETLDAQSAKIDMVSGATVTSDGYLQSLQSALDAAGI